MFDRVVDLFVPLAFIDAKETMLPISRILLKWAMSEHLASFNDPVREANVKNLCSLIVFWLRHRLMTDSFFA